jgi:hypothetical protein
MKPLWYNLCFILFACCACVAGMYLGWYSIDGWKDPIGVIQAKFDETCKAGHGVDSLKGPYRQIYCIDKDGIVVKETDIWEVPRGEADAWNTCIWEDASFEWSETENWCKVRYIDLKAPNLKVTKISHRRKR